MLDQQVTRAALKSYKALRSSSAPAESQLSSFTRFLRVFIPGHAHSQLPSFNAPWDDSHSAILLLEWRAALSVRAYANHQQDPDASIDHRVSKAVTEAFVASQIGEMMHKLDEALPSAAAHIPKRVFTLVS